MPVGMCCRMLIMGWLIAVAVLDALISRLNSIVKGDGTKRRSYKLHIKQVDDLHALNAGPRGKAR